VRHGKVLAVHGIGKDRLRVISIEQINALVIAPAAIKRFLALVEAERSPLLHRHTLGQIPRLVHIRSSRAGRVIRQQLQRDGMQDG